MEEQAKSTSGQAFVVFQPGHHPNLPGVQTDQPVLCFPGGQAQGGMTNGVWQMEGDHLARLGLEEGDVLACRMPDFHTGSQVVVSVGLGLDLARLGNKRKQNKERVVTWLSALLELSFPDKLRSSALDLVWEMLEENLEYVGECGVEEANQFSESVLELPEDVVEIFLSEPQVFQSDISILCSPFSGEYSFLLNSEETSNPELALDSRKAYGGTLLMWKSELDPFVTPLPTTSPSFLPILLKIPGFAPSIHIALYLPTSGRDPEFVSALSLLDLFLEEASSTHQCQIYIRGDANCNPNNVVRSSLLVGQSGQFQFNKTINCGAVVLWCKTMLDGM